MNEFDKRIIEEIYDNYFEIRASKKITLSTLEPSVIIELMKVMELRKIYELLDCIDSKLDDMYTSVDSIDTSIYKVVASEGLAICGSINSYNIN